MSESEEDERKKFDICRVQPSHLKWYEKSDAWNFIIEYWFVKSLILLHLILFHTLRLFLCYLRYFSLFLDFLAFLLDLLPRDTINLFLMILDLFLKKERRLFNEFHEIFLVLIVESIGLTKSKGYFLYLIKITSFVTKCLPIMII